MRDKIIHALLIEDDPDDTLLLMTLMAQSDWASFRFSLDCAENLKIGLKILAEKPVEVVILDLTLPDSRGLETLSRVHAQAPEVPVVVLTGLRDEELGLEAVRRGAQDYQVKGSIHHHVLKRTISYAVERHRSMVSLKNVIASAPDGMMVLDSRGVVRHVNLAAEELFALRAEALVGKPAPCPLPAGRWGEARIGGRAVETRLSQISWENEPAALVSLRDITELRRVEQLKAEVEESRKMGVLKDELMSAVSHDLRNPLTVIKAAAGNLRDGCLGPLSRKQAALLGLQYRNILRMEKIVCHILDLSRLESGRAQIRPRRVDASKLIREAVLGFELLTAERGIQIRSELARGDLFIHADPELFVQTLSNLLDNAMRFTRSTILIQAGLLKGPLPEGSGSVPDARKYVRFSVIDDGQGIPEESQGRLFNKFVQVSRRPSGEQYKGTGLGLAICKEIVKRQGGRIWVESRPGQGARFHFVLPLWEPAPASRREPSLKS